MHLCALILKTLYILLFSTKKMQLDSILVTYCSIKNMQQEGKNLLKYQKCEKRIIDTIYWEHRKNHLQIPEYYSDLLLVVS